MRAACLFDPLLAGAGPGAGRHGSERGRRSARPSEACTAAGAATGRAVTFAGQMETVPGARRMAMQIVVQERAPGEVGFHTLTADGLGSWQRSEVGVKIYKYVRQVTDLPSPAAFRAVIEYRWLNEKGHVIRSDERRTPSCRQPDDRSKPASSPAAHDYAPHEYDPRSERRARYRTT